MAALGQQQEVYFLQPQSLKEPDAMDLQQSKDLEEVSGKGIRRLLALPRAGKEGLFASSPFFTVQHNKHSMFS